MIAQRFSMQTVGLPYITLWHTIMQHYPPLVVHEYTQTTIRVVQNEEHPTRGYLGRTHSIIVTSLQEVFQGPSSHLV